MAIAELTDKQPSFEIEPIEYPVALTKIAELSTAYMKLTVSGIDDKPGLAAVHAARIEIKNYRVAVEKRRVKLKESSLDYGRKVDSVAKQLTAALVKIEGHLESQESIVEKEQERLAKIEIARKQAALQDRIEQAQAFGATPNPMWLAEAPESAFQEYIAKAKADHEAKKAAEAERVRIQAEEDERRRKEAEALAAERARLDAIAAQQKAEADRIAAEQQAERDRLAEVAGKQKAEADRLNAEADKQRRDAKLAKAKAEAAERARVETEARLKREADANAERERIEAKQKQEAADRAEAARLKAEEERPYVEKMVDYVKRLSELPVPAGPWTMEVLVVVAKARERIEEIIGVREVKF